MNQTDYTSQEFANQVAEKTLCGPHAWHRFMTWLKVDEPFQAFMEDWNTKIAPYYHKKNIAAEDLPDISGILEEHFEQLYPAQFILRLYQLADSKISTWLTSSINIEQQEILYFWNLDSRQDIQKGLIADSWTTALDEESFSYKGTPVYASLTAEIFSTLGHLSSLSTKRLR